MGYCKKKSHAVRQPTDQHLTGQVARQFAHGVPIRRLTDGMTQGNITATKKPA